MKKNFRSDELIFSKPSESDIPRICQLLTLSFGFSEARALEYVDNVGLSEIALLYTGGTEASGCAGLIATSHVIGGRSVKASNIGHVALAPDARGTGSGISFVRSLCSKAKADGTAMVTLFASARPVYRKAGFAFAGHEIIYEAQTHALPNTKSAGFSNVAVNDPRLQAAYKRKTLASNGLLSRAPFHWKELLREPTHGLSAYAHILPSGEIAAYAVLDTHDSNCLHVRDWHVDNQDMAIGLLSFLGRFRSVYPVVQWHGGLVDWLILALPDKGWRFVVHEEWMANVIDPAAAMRQRGYIMASAEIGISLETDMGEAETYTLSVRDHVGVVQPGIASGVATVLVDRVSFASLFTGLHRSSELAHMGTCSGKPDALHLCDSIFSGPSPWVAEHF